MIKACSPDLRGVKLVISDAHEGIKASVSRVFSATWQRCRVHFSPVAIVGLDDPAEPIAAAVARAGLADRP